MNRIVITEIGDSFRKDLSQDFNFIKSTLRHKTSESTAELKKQQTLHPLLEKKELISIVQTKLYKMAKMSILGQVDNLQASIEQDLNIKQDDIYLKKNLKKLVHKTVEQDQFTKRKSQLLRQLMLMKQSERSRSNYTVAYQANEQLRTSIQTLNLQNMEGKLEKIQRSYCRQQQYDGKLRDRQTSCMDQSGMVISRKELQIRKSNIRIRQTCNKQINTDF